MYGVVNIISFPDGEDLKMLSLDLFDSFSKALAHTELIIKKFEDEYGVDIIEEATIDNPVAVMFNGEVTAYAYIVKAN